MMKYADITNGQMHSYVDEQALTCVFSLHHIVELMDRTAARSFNVQFSYPREGFKNRLDS